MLLLFGGEYFRVFPTLMAAMAFVRRRSQSYLSSCYLEAVKQVS